MGYRGHSHKGRRLFIAVTTEGGSVPEVHNDDLTESEFKALNWVEITGAGTVTPFSAVESTASFTPLNGVDMKDKGNINAGTAEQIWAIMADTSDGSRPPGQTAIIAAGETDDFYAFYTLEKDAPDATYNGSRSFSRALVPKIQKPEGKGEDFKTEMTTLELVQLPIHVAPELIA
jgi:hypothetical protein